jgi:hypothetical protein
MVSVYIIQRKYCISHPEPVDPAPSSEPPLEWMSYSSPPPASHTVLVPGDDLTNPVPLVATSHPPQALESGSHPVASISSSLVPPSAHASSHLTNEEAALLLRLYNLQAPAIDISHVMAAMSGHAEFTIDEVQLLWRLHNLNLTTEDTNFIVDTV